MLRWYGFSMCWFTGSSDGLIGWRRVRSGVDWSLHYKRLIEHCGWPIVNEQAPVALHCGASAYNLVLYVGGVAPLRPFRRHSHQSDASARHSIRDYAGVDAAAPFNLSHDSSTAFIPAIFSLFRLFLLLDAKRLYGRYVLGDIDRTPRFANHDQALKFHPVLIWLYQVCSWFTRLHLVCSLHTTYQSDFSSFSKLTENRMFFKSMVFIYLLAWSQEF